MGWKKGTMRLLRRSARSWKRAATRMTKSFSCQCLAWWVTTSKTEKAHLPGIKGKPCLTPWTASLWVAKLRGQSESLWWKATKTWVQSQQLGKLSKAQWNRAWNALWCQPTTSAPWLPSSSMMLTCSMQHVAKMWPWRWPTLAMKSWRRVTSCASRTSPYPSLQSSRPKSISLSWALIDRWWLQDMSAVMHAHTASEECEILKLYENDGHSDKEKKRRTRSLRDQIRSLFAASSLQDRLRWTRSSLRSSWAASLSEWMGGRLPSERSQNCPSQLVRMPKSFLCSPEWVGCDKIGNWIRLSAILRQKIDSSQTAFQCFSLSGTSECLSFQMAWSHMCFFNDTWAILMHVKDCQKTCYDLFLFFHWPPNWSMKRTKQSRPRLRITAVLQKAHITGQWSAMGSDGQRWPAKASKPLAIGPSQLL